MVQVERLNAPYFRSLGKRLIYVAERAVFELGDDGLVLAEVAPGLHPYFNILAWLPFPLKVHPRLKNMPAICFQLQSASSEGENL